MGNLVRAVRAVGQQASDVDVGKVGVGAAFRGGNADLGRSRMIVELDEEAFEQFQKGRLDKVARKLKVSVEDVKEASNWL